MRTLQMATATVVMAGSVGLALFAWSGKFAAGRPVAQAEAVKSTVTALVPVELVRHKQVQQQLARLTEGNVVLDMRALGSLEAAQDLVLHWRRNHPSEAHLACWVATNGDEKDLVNTVNALSQSGCSVLHVALDIGPAAAPVMARQ
jgi:hypothetical protein